MSLLRFLSFGGKAKIPSFLSIKTNPFIFLQSQIIKSGSMKQLSILLLSFFLTIQLVGQTITPEMGKRLTAWCNSKDERMATALSILREKYPNSNNLMRKVDDFENCKEDTRDVLLSLYRGYGADWAYSAIHHHFTLQQLTTIEQLYMANGGIIKKERTDEERKQKSNLALKRGITIDIANRLSSYIYQRNNNFQYFAIGIITEKGVSEMGSYRIIDNLSNNLDYVEEILFRLYDTYGAENAYYTFREFLTSNQISALDGMYANWKIIKEKQQQEADRKKKEQIQHIEDSIHQLEPFSIVDFPNEYNNIKDELYFAMYKCLSNYHIDNQTENYSITLSDDITIDPKNGTTHSVDIASNPHDSVIIYRLTTAIKSIEAPVIKHIINKYNYSFEINTAGHFDLQYDFQTKEHDFYVIYTSSRTLELKEGDEPTFQYYYNDIREYIRQHNERRRNKIRIKQYFVNGEIDSFVIMPQ